MRYPSAGTSWQSHKERGRQAFTAGDYVTALEAYRAAVQLNPPSTEQQILLSNCVACRLKIGTAAQARAAVGDAQQCVALNPSWAKAHVRLAEAYIAVGGHSNEACNSLQTALRLDPGNAGARQMLVRELRRDHASAYQSSASSGIDDDEDARDPPENPHYQARRPPEVDDSLSWPDRLRFTLTRAQQWYSNQPDVIQGLVKLAGLVLVLYVAFGGRFGFEYLPRRQRGHYGSGNAYERSRRRAAGSYSSSSTYSSHDNDHYYPTRRSSSSSGWDWSSLWILLPMLLVAQRLGINPFHALMMMQMAQRRRGMRWGRGMGGGWGGGGWGGYYGGRRRMPRRGW